VATKLDGTIDVTQVFSTEWAFAALRADGSVVTWGDADYGGDSSAVATSLDGTIDVTQVFSNYNAFAALRADGSVVTWGDADSGRRQQRRGHKTRWHDRRDAGVFDRGVPLPRCAPMARW
jgi:alpha-tubulin suppressor-like RCC1 family protein